MCRFIHAVKIPAKSQTLFGFWCVTLLQLETQFAEYVERSKPMLGTAEQAPQDFLKAWVAYQVRAKSQKGDEQDDKTLGPVNKHGRPYE
jgi:hypothetical protein